VLATLHTNDAPGAVARLLDMNIEPYLLAGALNGVVAQRLVRTICSGCDTKYFPDAIALEDAGIPDQTGRPFRKGVGCQQCHNSGYRGRHGLYEVMSVDPTLRRLINAAAPSHELRECWKQNGGRTLREEGVAMAVSGMTDLEEVLRATHDDEAIADEPVDQNADKRGAA
jgi:type II secretory ATPase GspE/PulE/Tfp pilus assembly ATPase PilB-like protein